ncbi:MAG TPA: GNAT family N-acetyltransferase [Actinomycetota bacterium]|nr:GNAT family N-acetyltransferase [Actinomycetota bacterium]
MRVVELHGPDELRRAWPVMSELRGHLSEDRWLELTEAMGPDGYRLLALEDDGGTIQALAGIRVSTNLYYGRHMWVDELVTASTARSSGHGRALLGHVEELAVSEGCEMVGLSSGIKRVDAHRFYEKHMGYDKASFTFTKHVGPVRDAMPPPNPEPMPGR